MINRLKLSIITIRNINLARRSQLLLTAGCIMAISSLAALPASAQQRRVVMYQTIVQGNRMVDIEAFVPDAVDEQPQFPGGDAAMIRFINRERRYPVDAYNAGVEGRVLCSFIVAPDGTIVSPEVIRGVEDSLNREALRVISSMPRWIAGRIAGESVPVYCILAIPFRL